MPERIIKTLLERWDDLRIALLFWGVGAAIGIGQHLMSKDPFSLRVVVGRALSVGGLAMCAGLILIPHPSAPLGAQIGLSALIASLGVNGIEAAVRRYLTRS